MFDRFIFDNISCNEYGVMCVSFSSTSLNTIAAQESELKTKKSIGSDTFYITSQKYTKPLVFTMQIVNRDFSPISAVQERALKKWLCKRGCYKLFCILDKRYADICFFANINNPKSIYITDTIGMEFTITTNAPFGFSDIRNKLWNMNKNDITEDFYIDNDEDLPIYPELVITVKESGTLTLINKSITDVPNTLIINNCSVNERITLECSYPYISSSITSHNVFNDFNKYWPYLIDGYNHFIIDKSCVLEFQYREYRKVSIV